MQTNRFIAVGIITSLAFGGIALGMEPNARYNTGEVLQKLLEGKSQIPGVSVADYQNSQNDTKRAEIEAKKKEIYARFEAQKKQIQSDVEAARKSFTEQVNALSEAEKAANKDSLYAQYKQIGIDAESKMKDLQSQMDAKMEEIKSLYDSIKPTQSTSQPSSEQSSAFIALDAKRKEIYTRFDTQKKQIQSDAEAARKALTEKANALSESDRAAQKDLLYAQYKQIGMDAESKMKDLQSQMDAKMKEIVSQYQSLKGGVTSQDGTKPSLPSDSTDKGKMKQEMMDKLSKIGDTSELSTVCKSTFETIRSERSANEKERKQAWSTFWDANKGAKKDIFVTDNREDVKDELDSMRLQIRIVEKNYIKGLYATSSVVSLDAALASIDLIAKNVRTDLEQYVQDGKIEQFNTFRDGFISVLKSNKKSLLTLAQNHAKTIMGLDSTCKKKAKLILTQTDSSDRQNQSQLNAVLNGGGNDMSSINKSTSDRNQMPPKPSQGSTPDQPKMGGDRPSQGSTTSDRTIPTK